MSKELFHNISSSYIEGGRRIKDSLQDGNQLSVKLSIKASHAGVVNGNNAFYTPKSMINGHNTLTFPFKKHLQNLHNGAAVGVIHDANYINYMDNYPPDFNDLVDKLNTAKDQYDLVTAAKQIVSHPLYKDKSQYHGLGVLSVNAELFDNNIIEDLATGTNKGKVSIDGISRNVFCSVCSEQFKLDHKHIRGKMYDGERCFAIYDDMKLDHIGFVPDPADEKTETVILSDSETFFDTSVSIETIKIQDNKQDTNYIMNMSDFKSYLQNEQDLFSNLIEGIDDMQRAKLKEMYTRDTSRYKSSSFLLQDERLLPLKTKEDVAIAALAISRLEDGSDKEMLQDALSTYIDKYFKDGQDVTQYLLSLVQTVKEEATETAAEEAQEQASGEEVASQEQEVVEGNKIASVAAENMNKGKVVLETESGTITTTQGSRDISAKAYAHLEPTQIDDLVSKVTNALKDVILENKAPVVIQDSVQSDYLKNRTKQLQLDYEAVDALNTELTQLCRNSLVEQIATLKKIDLDSEYVKSLKTRDIDALSLLLEDTKLTLSPKTHVATTAAVPEEESKVLEPTSISDSLQTASETTTETAAQPDANPILTMRKVGVSAYLKNMKK